METRLRKKNQVVIILLEQTIRNRQKKTKQKCQGKEKPQMTEKPQQVNSMVNSLAFE